LGIEITLQPTLEHCIETTAKKELSRTADDYIERAVKNSDTEEKIELLQWFLQSMDFRALRKKSEVYLLQGRSVRFRLYIDNGNPSYEMQVD